MHIQQFLDHHGIGSNPFTEEDAQTDKVFKGRCISDVYHPSWDKVYGDPEDPATSVVFGEKGAGKTAIRLQIAQHIAQRNVEQPEKRVFVIEYDNFNPFLDRFRDRLSGRNQRGDRALSQWKLWDHMDCILAVGLTRLVDQIVAPPGAAESLEKVEPRRLDRSQARDLLLLAACYDHSTATTLPQRWRGLRRALRFRTWKSRWAVALGILVTLGVAGIIAGTGNWNWLASWGPYAAAVGGWLPAAFLFGQRQWMAWRITRNIRVMPHRGGQLRRLLSQFSRDDLAACPLPAKERTDDRYELLSKFQGILRTLGYSGVVVLMDRVDEPHLINGSAELMKLLVWPMLDNKFLKQSGIGFKLLLPIELSHYVQREERDFYQRARLDKQNMIPSLEWTGEALYDVANARIQACKSNGSAPTLREMFDGSISEQRLIEAFRGLRVPRHLFKFLYRLLVAHANSHTVDSPAWQIPSSTFESVLAVFHRDLDAADRGVGTG